MRRAVLRRVALLPVALMLGWLLLSACGRVTAPATPVTEVRVQVAAAPMTPTPDPLRLYIQVNSSQATAQAAQATAQWYGAQATATEHMRIEQITSTAQARHEQMTATVQAFIMQATATAKAVDLTATARAWDATATADSIQATSTAGKTATASAIELAATQRAAGITATADAAAVSAYATAMAGKAESVRLAVEREQMTNRIQAFAPWGFLALALLAVLLVMQRRSRILEIERDPRGDAKLLVLDGKVVYDPDRNPAPVLDLSGGKPTTPIPADPATVARDQAIDLAHRGLPGGERKRIPSGRAAARLLAPQAKPKTQAPPVHINVLAPVRVKPIARDVLPSMLLDVVEGEVVEGPEGEGGEA